MGHRIRVLALVALSTAFNPGCAALIGAGGRELQDHGDRARYRNKSYGEHVIDELFEPEVERRCDCGRRARSRHRCRG